MRSGIERQLDTFHRPDFGEQGRDLVAGGVKVEIAYENLGSHRLLLSSATTAQHVGPLAAHLYSVNYSVNLPVGVRDVKCIA